MDKGRGGDGDVEGIAPAVNDRLLTRGEVAAAFRVSVKTVSGWARDGRLPSIRTPGGHRRFLESEVRALLQWLTEDGGR